MYFNLYYPNQPIKDIVCGRASWSTIDFNTLVDKRALTNLWLCTHVQMTLTRCYFWFHVVVSCHHIFLFNSIDNVFWFSVVGLIVIRVSWFFRKQISKSPSGVCHLLTLLQKKIHREKGRKSVTSLSLIHIYPYSFQSSNDK